MNYQLNNRKITEPHQQNLTYYSCYQPSQNISSKEETVHIKVEALEGNFDYTRRSRNARVSLVPKEPTILGLEPQTLGNIAAQQQDWNKANVIAKGSMALRLSQADRIGQLDIVKTQLRLRNNLKKSTIIKNFEGLMAQVNFWSSMTVFSGRRS